MKPRRRRAHRKSRQGCGECKARHIKCDESQPQCVNCMTTFRQCSFLASASSPGTPTSHHAVGKSSETESPQTPVPAPLPPSKFTAIHMTCLHHAETTMGIHMVPTADARPVLDLAIEYAETAPFLLDQVLALSALHLSTIDSAKQSAYHHQATELQTRALELFNQSREEETNNQNCIPTFLFASLLGIHVLRETLFSHHDDLSAFTDTFVRYVRLHRGVRAVLANGSWDIVRKSELKPLLILPDYLDVVKQPTPGGETRKLREFLGSYDTIPDTISACQKALEWVQWIFDIGNLDVSMVEPGVSRERLVVHAIIAWPILVPYAYIENLHQRKPEAYAVLALFMSAMDLHQDFWVFGESGSSLGRLITSSIGPFWRDKLGLPIQSKLPS